MLANQTAALGVAGERLLVQQLNIVAMSRVLANPLAAHVRGTSSSGKSFIVRTVASTMPPEEVVQAHDFTEQSFYYLPSGSLRHKVVVSGERERERDHDHRARLGSKAFREMVEDGVLRKCVTVSGSDGQLTTKLITQEGPIAYIETSTAEAIHEEDRTRMLLLQVNEDRSQTKSVITATQRNLEGKGPNDEERARIRLVLQTAQRLLDPGLRVLIPFAHLLKLPPDVVAARRTMRHLGALLQTVTFLRQKQKVAHDIDGHRTIFADADDYRVFLPLAAPLLASVFDPLGEQARATLARIEQEFGTERFTRLDLSLRLGISEGHASRRMRPLIELGLVTQDISTRPYRHVRSSLDPNAAPGVSLPSPERVACDLARERRRPSAGSAHAGRNSLDDSHLSVRGGEDQSTRAERTQEIQRD